MQGMIEMIEGPRNYNSYNLLPVKAGIVRP